MTELIFSCITIVFNKLLCICVASSQPIWLETGISARDGQTTFHISFELFGFAPETFVTPQVCNGVEVGRLSWPLLYLNYFCLELELFNSGPNCLTKSNYIPQLVFEGRPGSKRACSQLQQR